MATSISASVTLPGAFVVLNMRGDQDEATVVRNEPGGTVRTVRGSPFTLSGGQAYANDYEAPFDTPVTYTVTSGTVSASSAQVTVPSGGRDWVRCLDNPVRSIPVNVVAFPEKHHDGRVSLYQVVGRRLPVAVTDVMSGAQGTLTLYLAGSDAATMDDILASGFPLMLHTPPSHGEDRFYFVVQGATWRRVSRLADQAARVLEMEVVEVDATRQILGISIQQYTWASLAVAFHMWDDGSGDSELSVASMYGSWTDVVLAGVEFPGV